MANLSLIHVPPCGADRTATERDQTSSAAADRRNAITPKSRRLDGDERPICGLAHQAACRIARNDFLAALEAHEPAAKVLIALANLGKA